MHVVTYRHRRPSMAPSLPASAVVDRSRGRVAVTVSSLAQDARREFRSGDAWAVPEREGVLIGRRCVA
jgi:hypothetical protein